MDIPCSKGGSGKKGPGTQASQHLVGKKFLILKLRILFLGSILPPQAHPGRCHPSIQGTAHLWGGTFWPAEKRSPVGMAVPFSLGITLRAILPFSCKIRCVHRDSALSSLPENLSSITSTPLCLLPGVWGQADWSQDSVHISSSRDCLAVPLMLSLEMFSCIFCKKDRLRTFQIFSLSGSFCLTFLLQFSPLTHLHKQQERSESAPWTLCLEMSIRWTPKFITCISTIHRTLQHNSTKFTALL